jgi:hypothetical protein
LGRKSIDFFTRSRYHYSIGAVPKAQLLAAKLFIRENAESILMISKSILDWLLDGDPSIRWQTLRDLAGANSKTVESERRKVVRSGWAARLLSLQDQGGRWAGGLYTPKWKSTTYTMLLLRDLGVPGNHPKIRQACERLLDKGFYRDGGINYSFSMNRSETCVTGMVLSILVCFEYRDDHVRLMAEHLLMEQMPDGGWNCQRHRGATHGRNRGPTDDTVFVSAEVALRRPAGAGLFPGLRRKTGSEGQGCDRACPEEAGEGRHLAAAEPAFRENIFRAGEDRKAEPLEYPSGFEGASMV